jgi:hypothetical protein
MAAKNIFMILGIPVLSACGQDNAPAIPGSLDVNIAPLQQVTDIEQFEVYLKNGLYIPSSAAVTGFVADDSVSILTATPEVSDTTSISADEDFSTTNTQEQNVDESDVIKYDGQFIYIATTPEYDYVTDGVLALAEPITAAATTDAAQADEITAGIRVMQRTGPAEVTEVAWPRLEDTDTIDSLYLYQDTLVSIGSGFGEYSALPVMYDLWYWGEPETVLHFYDVGTPADMVRTHDISIQGYLETSRRIDNMLYLVTRFTPYIPELVSLQFEEKSASVDDIIEQTGIDELLPTITIDGVVQPLVLPTQCYLPGDATESDGYAGLLVITAINLLQPDNFDSVCFNAMSQGIYVSENAMYISASSLNDETAIHKFDLDGDLDSGLDNGALAYSATGFIEGNLGWRNPAFRMSEFDGYLRVISTIREGFNDFIHQLYVLEDNQAGLLEQRSLLPNEEFPEKIGKPGEDITAVRYYGSRAYVVTFEQTDPLYVINIADQQRPFIEGSLEIPGFSSYLHPVNDDLLLGIGWDSGVKLSLFDVSDVANPIELSHFVWQDAYSSLQHDHKALAFLEHSPGQYRFSFVVNTYSYSATADSSENGLQLFDLATNQTGPAVLTRQGVLTVDEYSSTYRDRSILHGEEVFYVHGNRVWSAPWSLAFILEDQ